MTVKGQVTGYKDDEGQQWWGWGWDWGWGWGELMRMSMARQQWQQWQKDDNNNNAVDYEKTGKGNGMGGRCLLGCEGLQLNLKIYIFILQSITCIWQVAFSHLLSPTVICTSVVIPSCSHILQLAVPVNIAIVLPPMLPHCCYCCLNSDPCFSPLFLIVLLSVILISCGVIPNPFDRWNSWS